MPFCPNCGTQVKPGSNFCEKCGARLGMSGVAGTAEPDAAHAGAGRVARPRPASGLQTERMLNIALAVFALGMILLFMGLSGRILMGRAVSALQKAEFVQGDDSLSQLVNSMGRREALSFLKAVVRNDPSGFVSAAQGLTSKAANITGDPYGVSGLLELLSGPAAETVFEEMHNAAKEYTGRYWNVLKVMVYYRDILYAGAIAACGGALIWYLLGGRLRDLTGRKAILALWCPCGVGAMLLTLSNILAATISLS